MHRAALIAADRLPAEAVLGRIRIPFIQRAQVRHGGGTEDLFLIDLGLRGVFLERASPLPRGDEVEIAFPLPGNERRVTARCRIAWWHPPDMVLTSKTLPSGLGLEFVECEGDGAARIRRHVTDYLLRNPRARRFNRRPEPDEEEP